MGKIIILDENTSNKIAAGEIIERPASVIKELVENSIDAGSSSINVEIRDGGVSYIKISDNGSGIYEDDVEIAFERHATSKIRNSNDLDSISTLGFRGEALASIAAVSSLELFTRVKENDYGVYLKIQGGSIKEIKHTGCPVGTTFVIRNLFYNTPARYKFLKKDSTEAGFVSDIISRIALANPQISFRYSTGDTVVLHTPGNNDLMSVIFSIYGKETARDLALINYADEKIKVTGFAGLPSIARSNRNCQSFYINGRYIKSKLISAALDEAYKTSLMKNKYPFAVINIIIDPVLADINVHPSKMEVKFSDEQHIFRSIYHSVENALMREQAPKYLQTSEKTRNNPFELTAIGVHQTKPIVYDTPQANEKIMEQVKLTVQEAKAAISETNAFDGYIPIGQLFNTYLIFERENDILLIDQHAAHERLKYEELIVNYNSSAVSSQMLLTPLVLELTYKELKFLEEEKEFFQKMGFTFENFGNNSIIVRAVPINDISVDIKELFLSIIDTAINTLKAGYEKAADEILYSVACKAAVKANKRLDTKEMQGLLLALGKLSNPYTCPHGRPTILCLTRYELEKMFKRIV